MTGMGRGLLVRLGVTVVLVAGTLGVAGAGAGASEVVRPSPPALASDAYGVAEPVTEPVAEPSPRVSTGGGGAPSGRDARPKSAGARMFSEGESAAAMPGGLFNGDAYLDSKGG
jgi:hypothetical protein